jgi:hypothetical protein
VDTSRTIRGDHHNAVGVFHNDNPQEHYLTISAVNLRLIDLPAPFIRNDLLRAIQNRFQLGQRNPASLHFLLRMS